MELHTPTPLGPTAELDQLGDQIAELSAHLDAGTARLLDLIREFDARGGWNSGFRSCAAWLTWRVGLSPGAAREHVRVARALGTLPRLRQALARGELSYSKVRELTRVATPETEARLLAVGRAGTADHVERIVRGWRRMDAKAEARETARRHASRALHVYQDEDGMVVLRGRLAPEVGALLVQALAAAREALYQRAREETVPAEASPADTSPIEAMPPLAQQHADALALLAETALHHGIDPGTPGERYQVVIHIDAPALADPEAPGQSVLEDGSRVPAGTSQRLACDASRVVMRHDADGRLLEIGARTRTIPPALRRALQQRDQSCRFPGCGLPFGQGHREAALPTGYVEDLGQLLLENPNIRHFAEHPRSPHVVKISDFVTTREFRQTRVYHEVYKRTGTIHQIGMSVTTARGAFVGIALNRDRFDFTERDRRILDILRPYLVRSYQNARAFSRVRGTLALLERGFAALEIAVVVLTAHRRVLFSSPMAERLMAGYFGTRRANGLPDLLERWLAVQDASGGDGLPHPQAPFILERDDRRLTVRVLRQPGRRLLLLTEIDARPHIERSRDPPLGHGGKDQPRGRHHPWPVSADRAAHARARLSQARRRDADGRGGLGAPDGLRAPLRTAPGADRGQATARTRRAAGGPRPR